MKVKNKILFILLLFIGLLILFNPKSFAGFTSVEIIDSENNHYTLPDVYIPDDSSLADFPYFFYFDSWENCYFLYICTEENSYFEVHDYNDKFAVNSYNSSDQSITASGYKFSLSNDTFTKTDRSGYYGVTFRQTDTVFAYHGNIVDNTNSQVFPQLELTTGAVIPAIQEVGQVTQPIVQALRVIIPVALIVLAILVVVHLIPKTIRRTGGF